MNILRWPNTVVQSLSLVKLFVTPWTATHQIPLFSTITWNLFKFLSIESVMLSNHLFLCCLLLLLPSSGSFPMSWLFISGGQSMGASASIFPVNIQDWFPLGLAGLISLLCKGLSSVFLQHHSSKASILWCSAFFMVQLSHPYMTTGKTIVLIVRSFVSKVMSLLFVTLSSFVIACLPGTECLNFMATVTILNDFGASEKKICHCFHFFSIYHKVMGVDAMILVFWLEFQVSFFTLLFHTHQGAF